MDENFYEILTKHLLGQASREEELRVAAFKAENPQAYESLKKFFHGKQATVRDLDSKEAWKKVLLKYESQHGRAAVPMYRLWWRAAAALALLLLCWFVADYYTSKNKLFTLTALGSQQDSVVLHDGTVVWLGDEARLEYPSRFDESREVVLLGEAFFDVVKDPGKPFRVVAGSAQVRVLGTSFNVNTAGQTTEVSVATGSVEVSEMKSGNKVVLEPGFTAMVSGAKIESFPTADPNYNSWVTGFFSFHDTPLSHVISALNKYYDLKLQMEGGDTGCALTAKFEREPLADIVEVLELTCSISAVKTADGYIFRPDNR